MISESKAQKLIACLTTMRELLTELEFNLKSLSTVIQDEQDAIQRGQLPIIEGIVKKKVQVGNLIEQEVTLFSSQVDDLGQDFNELSNAGASGDVKLSGFARGLILLQARMKREMSETAYKIMSHLVEALTATTDRVVSLSRDLSPKIKANAYLVRKLLFHHQETYRFWQSIAQDTQSVYSAKGRSQAQSSSSIFRVKT